MLASLERFWSDVLSETPDRVIVRLAALDELDRQAVLLHLRRMAGEAGWSETQQRRAVFALHAWERRSNEAEPSPSPSSA